MTSERFADLAKRCNEIKEQVRLANQRGGGSCSDVSIIAVTKTAKPEEIAFLIKEGHIDSIGENRLQDALERWKHPSLSPLASSVQKHFIGHLQTNKIGKAVSFFDWIDSADNEKLLTALDQKCAEKGKILPVLIQIKLTEKETQSGQDIDGARRLAGFAAKLKNLKPMGYMGIAPMVDNPEELRPVFKKVKQAFTADFGGTSGARLSLGMSADFVVAVEEGSNMPRIGGAIFAN